MFLIALYPPASSYLLPRLKLSLAFVILFAGFFRAQLRYCTQEDIKIVPSKHKQAYYVISFALELFNSNNEHDSGAEIDSARANEAQRGAHTRVGAASCQSAFWWARKKAADLTWSAGRSIESCFVTHFAPLRNDPNAMATQAARQNAKPLSGWPAKVGRAETRKIAIEACYVTKQERKNSPFWFQFYFVCSCFVCRGHNATLCCLLLFVYLCYYVRGEIIAFICKLKARAREMANWERRLAEICDSERLTFKCFCQHVSSVSFLCEFAWPPSVTCRRPKFHDHIKQQQQCRNWTSPSLCSVHSRAADSGARSASKWASRSRRRRRRRSSNNCQMLSLVQCASQSSVAMRAPAAWAAANQLSPACLNYEPKKNDMRAC